MAKKEKKKKKKPPCRTAATTAAPGALLLRRHVVQAITSLPRATIYDLMAAGKFPHPVTLSPGGGRVAWVRTEIDAWLADRIAARSAPSKAVA